LKYLVIFSVILCNFAAQMNATVKDFEIMAPVGSRESLAAAVQAGADSIYFGIETR